MEQIFGGSPLGVILRLVIISMIVGIILAALGIDALDIFNSLQRLVEKIYNLGFDAVEWAFRYFLVGAALVIPVWVIYRLYSVTVNRGQVKDK